MGICPLDEVLYLNRLLERMISPDLKWNPYIQTNTEGAGKWSVYCSPAVSIWLPLLHSKSAQKGCRCHIWPIAVRSPLSCLHRAHWNVVSLSLFCLYFHDMHSSQLHSLVQRVLNCTTWIIFATSTNVKDPHSFHFLILRKKFPFVQLFLQNCFYLEQTSIGSLPNYWKLALSLLFLHNSMNVTSCQFIRS